MSKISKRVGGDRRRTGLKKASYAGQTQKLRKGGQVPSFWYTETKIFKIHQVEIKLGRNLVGGLDIWEERPNRQIIPLFQAAGSSLYQVVIQSSESSKTAPFLDPC